MKKPTCFDRFFQTPAKLMILATLAACEQDPSFKIEDSSDQSTTSTTAGKQTPQSGDATAADGSLNGNKNDGSVVAADSFPSTQICQQNPADGAVSCVNSGASDSQASQQPTSEPGSQNNPNNGSRVQITDEFFQNVQEAKKLDVMLVVDNSGSMAEEQRNLADKLSRIFDFVQSASWRIAIRTTDPRERGVRLVVDKDDRSMSLEEKHNLMRNTISRFGTQGSGNEQGMPMAVNGLSANIPGTSRPWLRADSMVAVLIVSDEDNCSDGRECNPAYLNEASYLLNYLAPLSTAYNIGRELGVSAKVYGLIRRNANECQDALHVGNKYVDAITASHGLAGRICDDDYSPTLSAMSADLGAVLNLSFVLSQTPIDGSIMVFVNGAPYSGSYLVNGKTLGFSMAPPAGAHIVVTYETVK